MMTQKEINRIVQGLIEEVGNDNVYDILNHLNIRLIRDNDIQNPILKLCDGIYIRNMFDQEVIIIKDNLENERQVLAHELGHAMLHTQYDSLVHNKFALPGRNEKEADFFSMRLLYGNLDLKSFSNYTKSEIAATLKVREDCIDYIVNKD